MLLSSALVLGALQRSSGANAPVPWNGMGAYRLLVRVDPLDIGARTADERPAEIAVDFSTALKHLGASGAVNVASIQLMKYDPRTGQPQPFSDNAHGRSAYDRPFRWYDGSIPYDFPEFFNVPNRTNGEIRRANRARGGYFYAAIGEWRNGRLGWVHTQTAREPSYYAIYFDLLPDKTTPRENPPGGWLGDGMQRLDVSGQTTTGASHTSVALDDWDGDGRVDILFGEDYGHLFWYRNTGTAARPNFPAYRMIFDAEGLPIDAGMGLQPLVVDWDGDGKKDLLAGTHWNRTLYYRNEGSNRDRKLVYKGVLNQEGKPFELPIRPLVHGSTDVFKEDYYPVLDMVDWNGDGKPDLLAGGYVTGRIFLYENEGREPDGMPILKFAGPLEADGKPINVGEWCASPTAADFDGDGDLDLVSGRYSWSRKTEPDNFLRYYENVGTRTDPVLQERPFPREGTPPSMNLSVPRAADINGDGLLDLVVSTSSGNIYLFENGGSRTQPRFRVNVKPMPARWGRADLPTTGAYSGTQFLDWTNDKVLDVVTNLKVAVNTGKGNPGVFLDPVPVLPSGESITHSSGIGDDWFWPRMYDLDRDGRIDVLFGDWGGRVWFHRNLSEPARPHYDTKGYPLKTSDGSEIRVGPVGGDPKTNFTALQGARTVFTAADFDSDGLDDLVVGDTFGIARYYRNLGPKDNPVFSPAVQIGNTRTRGMVDAIDWNNDGRMDVIAGTAGIGPVTVYVNTGERGAAAFAPGVQIKMPPIIEPRVIPVDWNGDGDVDLFVPGTQGSSLVERSFLEHGYAQGQLLTAERRRR